MNCIRDLIFGVSIVFALISAPAMADIEKEMNSMLGSMSNTTSPQASMGPRRGVISGGAYSMRNSIKPLHLATIEPPSFQAGCSGIDAYFGSMSFISKEQAVEMMRAIASNAAGYAFSMAIEAACPTCATEMKAWSAKMQQNLNKLSNSCEAAQAALGYKDMNGNNTSGGWFATMIGTDSGSAEDANDAQTSEPNGKSPTDKAAETDPEAFSKNIESNVVWQALKNQPVEIWWDDNDSNLKEEIMSLTGSVVSCHLAINPGCGRGQQPVTDTNGMVTYRLEPRLQLQDLVFGGPGGTAERYACPDDLCYGPDTVGFPMEGLSLKIKRLLVGEDGTGGMVEAFVSPAGQLSPEQNALLVNLGTLAQVVVLGARVDPNIGRHLGETLAPKIALDMANDIARNAMRTVTLSTSQMYGSVAGESVKDLHNRSEELQRQYQKIDKELEANLWALEYARAVISFSAPLPVYGFKPNRTR